MNWYTSPSSVDARVPSEAPGVVDGALLDGLLPSSDGLTRALPVRAAFDEPPAEQAATARTVSSAAMMSTSARSPRTRRPLEVSTEDASTAGPAWPASSDYSHRPRRSPRAGRARYAVAIM